MSNTERAYRAVLATYGDPRYDENIDAAVREVTDLAEEYGRTVSRGGKVSGVYKESHGGLVKVTAIFPDTEAGTDAANEWMESHPEEGVLATEDGYAYVANVHDMGLAFVAVKGGGDASQ